MADLNGFDANVVPENTGFDPVPAGEYDVIITDSGKDEVASGGSQLKLTLQIINGPYQNRLLWDRLSLWLTPTTEGRKKAIDIAKGNLSSICRAVGVPTPRDSVELHNKALKVKVAIDKDEKYGERNVIKGYKPRVSQTQSTNTMQPTQPPAVTNKPAGNPWA